MLWVPRDVALGSLHAKDVLETIMAEAAHASFDCLGEGGGDSGCLWVLCTSERSKSLTWGEEILYQV